MTDQATGVTEPAAGVENPSQEQAGQEQTGKEQTGQQTEAKKVEVTTEVLTALRNETKASKERESALKQELETLKAQTNLYQQQLRQQQAPQPQQQTQQAPNPFDGLSDDDIVTVSQIKAAMQAASNSGNPEIQETIGRMQAQMQEMEVRAVDPNYMQTIQKYGPEMANRYPLLAQAVPRSSNPKLAALQLAQMHPTYQQSLQQANPTQQTTQTRPDFAAMLDKVLADAQAPGSPAQVGGQGGISQADLYATMTDEEFQEKIEQVKQGG
jgi:hypothetical protein